jgi:hypothetical protein
MNEYATKYSIITHGIHTSLGQMIYFWELENGALSPKTFDLTGLKS